MSQAGDFPPDPADTIEVTPQSVAQWIKLPVGQRPCLLDCREMDELAICSIAGHTWIPLGRIPAEISKLAEISDRGLVIYCHHGMRSLRAAEFLRARGVSPVFSMRGGIDAWSMVIDPAVPRY